MCSNVRTLTSPAHSSQLLSDHLQGGGERGGEGGGAMNSTTVARSELSLCECESAGEQVSERKCVRCRERVCVFARARVCQKRERVCAGAGKASAVFLKRKTQPASLLCLSVDYTTTGDSPFGLFRRFRLPPSCPHTCL